MDNKQGMRHSTGNISTQDYANLLKTPDSYFCTKSGKDRRITIGVLNNKNKKINNSDSEDEEYLSNLNNTFKNNFNLKERYTLDQSIASEHGKNGHVFFVKKEVEEEEEESEDREIITYAVKRQFVVSPTDRFDKAYRELIIFQRLGDLMQSNRCCNFVQLVEWYKSSPMATNSQDVDEANQALEAIKNRPKVFSRKMLAASADSNATRASLRSQQYMNYVMEYADLNTLAAYKSTKDITISHYQSIMFQIIYALSVAQKHLEFMHNDLHIGNILMQSFEEPYRYLMYRDGDRRWFVGHNIVKISDYGLSRISIPKAAETKDPDNNKENIVNNSNINNNRMKKRRDVDDREVIYNTRNPDSLHFLPPNDVIHLVQSLKNVKISDVSDPANANLKREMGRLKKMMQECAFPHSLISHPFFDSLGFVPHDATFENCLRMSSDGIVNDKEDREYFEMMKSNHVSDEEDDTKDNNGILPPKTPVSILKQRHHTPAGATPFKSPHVKSNLVITPGAYQVHLRKTLGTRIGFANRLSRAKSSSSSNQQQQSNNINNNNSESDKSDNENVSTFEQDNSDKEYVDSDVEESDDSDIDEVDFKVGKLNLNVSDEEEVEEEEVNDEEDEEEEKEKDEDEEENNKNQEIQQQQQQQQQEQPKRRKQKSKLEKLQQESSFIIKRLIN